MNKNLMESAKCSPQMIARTVLFLMMSVFMILFFLAGNLFRDPGAGNADMKPIVINPGGAKLKMFRSVPLLRGTYGSGEVPVLDSPGFQSAIESRLWLQPDSVVIGVSVDGEQKAYPLQLMYWHEIVNDRVGKQAITVTYCSLSHSSVAFARDEGDCLHGFGNSGLIYESNLVLSNRDDGELWYQLSGECISNESIGRRLQLIPMCVTTWMEWSNSFPMTKVLSYFTGFHSNYQGNYKLFPRGATRSLDAQSGYPVSRYNGALAMNEPILGVTYQNITRAYPIRQIASSVHDVLDGNAIEIVREIGGYSVRVKTPDGKLLEDYPARYAFWFAWQAAFPDGTIFTPGRL